MLCSTVPSSNITHLIQAVSLWPLSLQEHSGSGPGMQLYQHQRAPVFPLSLLALEVVHVSAPLLVQAQTDELSHPRNRSKHLVYQ